MPFETFPLPSPQPNPQAIEQRLGVQSTALMGLVQGILDYLETSLRAQQSALQILSNRAKQMIGTRIRKQQVALQPVSERLVGAVATNVAENGAKLAMLQATNPQIAQQLPPSAPVSGVSPSAQQVPETMPPSGLYSPFIPPTTESQAPTIAVPTSAPAVPTSIGPSYAPPAVPNGAMPSVVAAPEPPGAFPIPYMPPTGGTEPFGPAVPSNEMPGIRPQGQEIPPTGAGESAPAAPVIRLATCTVPLPEGIGLMPPGSKEWCQAIEAQLDLFAGAAENMWAWLMNLLDSSVQGTAAPPEVPSGLQVYSLGAILDFIAKANPQLVSNYPSVAQQLRDQLFCWRTWAETAFGQCNFPAMLGIMTVRSVLSMMRHIRFGTDALVWLTTDIDMAVEHVDHALEYMQRYVCPQDAPTPGEALEAWRFGYIDDDMLDCIYRLNGRDPDSHRPYIHASGEKLSAQEAIEITRRRGGDEAAEAVALRRIGWIDPDIRAKRQELYWEIPTIGEHLEWLRRNVFDDAYVEHFQLMEGFEERFWRKFGKDLTTLGMRKENAALHYAAHWIVPSATQLFEFTWRLRPGRQPDGLTFTRDDLLRVMAEQDYAPYYRERLERISHPAPSLTLIRSWYLYNQISGEELVEAVMDLGYTRDVAERMQRSMEFDVRRRRAQMGKGYTEATLSRQLGFGMITEELYNYWMSYLGYADDEIKQGRDVARTAVELSFKTRALRKVVNEAIKGAVDGYECGALGRDAFIAGMVGPGLNREAAVAWADAIDSSVQMGLCKERIRALKNGVMKGRLSLEQAEQVLIVGGMDPLRARQYRQSWEIELTTRSQAATAGTLLRWVAAGLMDGATASARLANLGWSDPDLTVMLAEARGRLTKREAAALAANTKTAQRAAKERQKLVHDALKQSKQLARDASHQASLSTLTKWYKDDLLTRDEYIQQLEMRGIANEYAQKYAADADKAKAKKTSGKAKKGPAPAPAQP